MNSKLPICLTPRFTLDEFLNSSYAFTHCLSNVFPKDYEDVYFNRAVSIAMVLEHVCDELGCRIHISSGFRTPAVNKGVGGVRNSRHLYMCAVDITVFSVSFARRLVRCLRKHHARFVKYYPAKYYLHVDWPAPFLDGFIDDLPF